MRVLIILALSGCLAFTQTASGTIYQIPVNSADGSVESSGNIDATYPTLLLSGELSSTLYSAIMPFAIPALLSNEVIIDAKLTFTARRSDTDQNGFPNGDLYGLPYRTTSVLNPTIGHNDYFEGSNDVNAAKLADNILNPSSSILNTLYDTTNFSGTNGLLTSYINNQIALGAQSNNFLFLRINMDAFQAGDARSYLIGSSEGGSGAVLALITSVPEPGAFLLVGTLGILFGGRRCLQSRAVCEC